MLEPPRVPRAHFRRASYLLELGDIQEAVTSVDMMSRVTRRLRQPIVTLSVLGISAAIALMRGALDEVGSRAGLMPGRCISRQKGTLPSVKIDLECLF
jgi:hypothetical protein